MPTEAGNRGAAVETAALSLLEQQGLVLLARNVGYRLGELDLVMADGQATVFVEVRHRRSQGFGGAAASIDRNKRRKVVAAAQLWLRQHPARAHWPCRFDVVLGHGIPPQLEWVRGAFAADDV